MFSYRLVINVGIDILNLNDNSPIFISSAFEFDVMENVPNGTLIGAISATDDDKGLYGELVYSLSEDLFVIDQLTGQIYTNGNLDREDRPIFNFQGLATDGGSVSSTGSTTRKCSRKCSRKCNRK